MTAKKRTTIKPDAQRVAIKYNLIEKYRGVVAIRYDYAELIKVGLPKKINEQVVNALRTYFLENLYPETAQREKLDAAFTQLENYVVNPAKIWDLLGNITSAIFKFGFQFPTAVRAGLISLEAYTSSKKFETLLTQTAIDKGYNVPITDVQFYDCIITLERDKLEKLIIELEHLFFTFTNTDLLGKTIGIMQNIIAHMQGKPKLYAQNEIDAIKLGLNIMQKGYDLFIQYDEDMKKAIVQFVSDNEKKFIAEVFK